MPNGVFLILYFGKCNIYIQANVMKCTSSKIYNINGNIKLLSNNGLLLKTEELLWNRKLGIIISKKYTTISNYNGILFRAKKGIEATENLKKIHLRDISGVFYI